ncbi:MAG: polysaccharide deacetylase family protein [Bacteroidales bacterium]|nr:polysaccharide deacetylase family protein [Bacteroidales bacterium]
MTLTPNTVEYAIQHLLRVALPGEDGFVKEMVMKDDQLQLHCAYDILIDMELLTDDEKGQLLAHQLKSCPLPSTPDAPAFRPARCQGLPELDVAERHLHIRLDLVTPTFLFLSRIEETQTDKRDTHGRFRYRDSLAYYYHCIDIPVVDEYAMFLRKALIETGFPQEQIHPRKGRLIPTHDIDHLQRFTGRWQAMKSIFGRDLLINQRLRVVKESLREYREWKQDSCRDPYITAIQDLLELEKGLPSVFFFMAQTKEDTDAAYDITGKEAAEALRMVREAGKTIGLHGSYDSYNDGDRLIRETSLLEEQAGQAITCGRQHYLRFEAGTDLCLHSLKGWLDSHRTDDYTLGYAEYAGFRCGTCHPFPLYDLYNDCPSTCIEHPLILMDGTLFDYLRLSRNDSKAVIQHLYQRCMAVEGDFVILWHNHLLRRNYYPLYRDLYIPLIQQHLQNQTL